MVKYYEEEVELNDICHFRIETSISDPNPDVVLTVSLMFVDLSNKKASDKMDVPVAVILGTRKGKFMQRSENGKKQEIPFDETP